MAASKSRSLGEGLSTNALFILLCALASVVSLFVFVTGKNLPDFVDKGSPPVLNQVELVVHVVTRFR